MKNLVEEEVRTLYQELRLKEPSFCSCERCRDDVLSLALNHLQPRYVSGSFPAWEAITRVELAREQRRAQLAVIVLEAMRRVGQNPNHPPAGGAPSAPGGGGGPV
jgi:competence protein ComFB